MRDMLTVPELRESEFVLMDINADNLAIITQLVRRDIEFNRVPVRISVSTHRRRALEGADFVYNVTRIGAWKHSPPILIFRSNTGIDQCVGDTLCIGGIMYGQRNIAAVLDFCKDI